LSFANLCNEYYTKLREHQRQIKQAIAELEQANSKR
jgi:hypothetical protein